MAETRMKRRGEMQRQVLAILSASKESLKARTVIQTAEEQMEMTPYEAEDYPKRPGVQRFGKILRFCTIGLVKAGWMIKNKGQWTVTEDGVKALERFQDPEEFARETHRLYKVWRAAQPDEEESTDSDGSPGAASTLEESEENAWTEIQEYLHKMPPYEFQGLVAALLKAMGYHVSWVSPPGKDGGVDILAHNDPLGTRPPRIKVQVKRIEGKVNVGDLRSFLAVLGDDDVGIFVALGGFTADAASEARTQEKRRITLIDLGKFFDLWVKHYDKIEEQEKKLLPLRPVYFLDPDG